jgi:uncharacterized membrane protein YeaQ/YmgE (transglycosylase-associated protein family)
MIGRKRGSYGVMMAFIVVLIVVGLIAGLLARLLVPGRDRMGILGTIVLGIVGSFLGGFIANLVEYHRLAPHRFHPAGIIGSVLGAIVVLLLLRVTGLESGHRRSSRRRVFR